MKRPPGDELDEDQMESKRSRGEEGGAAASQPGEASNPSAGADREHLLLMRVLQPAPEPAQKLSLAGLGDFLEEHLNRIGAQHPGKVLEECLQFLSRGIRRSEEGGVIPSTWAGIAPLQEACVTCALTRVLQASSEDKAKALLCLLGSPVPQRLIGELLSACSEDDAVPPILLRDIAKPLSGRRLSDLQSPQFAKLLRVLKASKKYSLALVSPPLLEELWRPIFDPKFTWRNRKREVVGKQREGFALQAETLLGWVLSPSALDSGLEPPSKRHLTESGSPEWSNMRRAHQQKIETNQRSTQMKLTDAQRQQAEFVDVLLRAGDAPRTAVLRWFGSLLHGAEPRGKQGYIVPEGFNFWPQFGNHVIDIIGHNDTPPWERELRNLLTLQALHARIHGFPTSGAALNAFTLLLHLVKPITVDKAVEISPYLALREDIPDILGSWQQESRFGEKEQIEAAQGVAKVDPAFTTAAFDKTLFKTQVFWLASKGLSVLLLPVAKEAFHSMQGIASAFFDKQPSVSDDAWREFLLAEASLKEPVFLERLGHFMTLSFRFLQHQAAGGKQALPPPEAGPAWHALPSTVLENLIDVCDIYRDRRSDRKGLSAGMPTGLFMHLDPDPVLTVLCIVMASDDHVRDPSLRGRAVKLLHRLCFSFTSWQARLMQSPFRQNLIPCLVGVFIAVEKAILSYYDLSYRYKYELRIPVMDLFDLAMKHEEHRQVLIEYANGPGRDRMLKLFTQLINDSNSQMEEAVSTLKDFREHLRKEAAGELVERTGPAAPTGGHDEVVGDDEQTQGGEDVYRRSRKNYKEHAKKYFGLATKTWKMLWLLSKYLPKLIVDGKTILEQLLHSSLDAQLHYLVGPDMKNVKGSEKDYEEFGFDPKALVCQIAEIYLFLMRVNRDEVVRIVAKDERYYSATTFSKAVRFTRKYHLLDDKSTEEFDAFVKELAGRVDAQRAAFDEADIPDKYLCEMMADIMSDPVMFPQSRKVVDRATALRQIMGNDRDPYANTPLKIEDLLPQPELKEEIHRFAKEKGIQLEGGNMLD